MRNRLKSVRRFLFLEGATSAVEYAVMLALIVVVAIVAIVGLGEAAYDALWDAVEALEETE